MRDVHLQLRPHRCHVLRQGALQSQVQAARHQEILQLVILILLPLRATTDPQRPVTNKRLATALRLPPPPCAALRGMAGGRAARGDQGGRGGEAPPPLPTVHCGACGAPAPAFFDWPLEAAGAGAGRGRPDGGGARPRAGAPRGAAPPLPALRAPCRPLPSGARGVREAVGQIAPSWVASRRPFRPCYPPSPSR